VSIAPASGYALPSWARPESVPLDVVASGQVIENVPVTDFEMHGFGG
jgi:hypothetical protein